MPTIREQLNTGVLEDRDNAAKSTDFSKQLLVGRGGDQILIPHQIRAEKALEAVKTWAQEESKVVNVVETIQGIPVDCVHALMLAVKHEFGVVSLKASGFFGQNPPPFLSVPTHTGETVDVYVGQFTLPGFEDASFLSFPADDKLALHVSAKLRNKDVPLFKQLITTARNFLQTHSLYKGHAITINFNETDQDEGPQLVIPKFWDVSIKKELILNADTEAMISATIWTPIRMAKQVKQMGTPIKRGVLLYGTFGTGKTLTAYQTAQLAVEAGFTFLYVKDVSQLPQAIEFASMHYMPAVIFMEDTEKAFEDPQQINIIQNTMDGIDGKARDLMVIFTTNHVNKLPPGIMRPGRLDTIIHIKPADATTASRLVKLYAGDKLDTAADMDRIGDAVRGNIPAAIREVVERAKLFALDRAGSLDFKISHEDIELSAKGMKEHMDLLNQASHERGLPSPMELFGAAVGQQVANGVREGVSALVSGSAFSGQPS